MNTDRFRFRVWDTENQRYVRTNPVLTHDGILGEYGDHDFMEYADCTVEQCTGVRDKNGKMIYEGDIVCRIQTRWDSNLQKIVIDVYDYIVEWNGLGLIIRNINDSMDTGIVWSPFNYTIIGNIHENKKVEK